ncbi:MAG TPA: ATPase, T2SS/T4P/T4SS family, partial [Azospirillaceae bacterium]|nr:ATPase, T2SS/T4P/T4SS family [Azospirillaceae bacterium]
MSDAVERLGGYFVDTGRLTPATLARARHACQESGEPLGAVLVSLGLVPEREVAAAFAAVLDLPLAGPHDYPAEPVLEHRLGVKFLRQARVLPLRDEPGRLVLAMADPGDGFALQALSVAAGKPVEPWAAVPADLEQAFARLYATGETVAPGPLEETGAVFEATQDDVERLKDLASEAPVIRFVNGLIARAVEARASDIHLEPFEASLRIRFRIDGDLREVENPPRRMAPAVVSRIKIMARLNIAERRLPQDGRIKMTVRGRAIDLRVSTVPTLHGEGVALRVLDRSSVRLDFAELGFSDDERRLWRDVLAKPNGIVLVTGPTGSGKTTTLYTSLVEMNTPDRKLFSIEDPIEYHLEGINQIQVHPQ